MFGLNRDVQAIFFFSSGVGLLRLMCSVFCKHGNEPSDFMKHWKFRDELSN